MACAMMTSTRPAPFCPRLASRGRRPAISTGRRAHIVVAVRTLLYEQAAPTVMCESKHESSAHDDGSDESCSPFARNARNTETVASFPPLRDLGLSDIGSDVAELQRQLHIQPTGRFDCRTELAVASWQRATAERGESSAAVDASFEEFAQAAPQRHDAFGAFDGGAPVQLVSRSSAAPASSAFTPAFAAGAVSSDRRSARGGMSAADAEAAAAAHRYAVDIGPGATSRSAAYVEAAAFAPSTVASVAMAPEPLQASMMPLMLDAVAATAPWAAIASGLAVLAAALSYSVRDAALADSQRLRPAFGGAYGGGGGGGGSFGAGDRDARPPLLDVAKIKAAAEKLLIQAKSAAVFSAVTSFLSKRKAAAEAQQQQQQQEDEELMAATPAAAMAEDVSADKSSSLRKAAVAAALQDVWADEAEPSTGPLPTASLPYGVARPSATKVPTMASAFASATGAARAGAAAAATTATTPNRPRSTLSAFEESLISPQARTASAASPRATMSAPPAPTPAAAKAPSSFGGSPFSYPQAGAGSAGSGHLRRNAGAGASSSDSSSSSPVRVSPYSAAERFGQRHGSPAGPPAPASRTSSAASAAATTTAALRTQPAAKVAPIRSAREGPPNGGSAAFQAAQALQARRAAILKPDAVKTLTPPAGPAYSDRLERALAVGETTRAPAAASTGVATMAPPQRYPLARGDAAAAGPQRLMLSGSSISEHIMLPTSAVRALNAASPTRDAFALGSGSAASQGRALQLPPGPRAVLMLGPGASSASEAHHGALATVTAGAGAARATPAVALRDASIAAVSQAKLGAQRAPKIWKPAAERKGAFVKADYWPKLVAAWGLAASEELSNFRP